MFNLKEGTVFCPGRAHYRDSVALLFLLIPMAALRLHENMITAAWLNDFEGVLLPLKFVDVEQSLPFARVLARNL